jgi:hypothetical protein
MSSAQSSENGDSKNEVLQRLDSLEFADLYNLDQDSFNILFLAIHNHWLCCENLSQKLPDQLVLNELSVSQISILKYLIRKGNDTIIIRIFELIKDESIPKKLLKLKGFPINLLRTLLMNHIMMTTAAKSG